jgi:alginate O-acetyltransferase complex protein AlgI
MLFTSYSFVFFIVIFFLLYRWSRWNAIALINLASIVFYGAWNPWFLILIFLSTGVDFYCSLNIIRFPARKRVFLLLSIVTNLSILGFFKYGGFLCRSVSDGLGLLGFGLGLSVPDFILPVGISFYTFQTMSYTIDVYRGILQPERNLSKFFLYVSFFPQLIAGPIERASNILPQIDGLQKYRCDYDGWGQALSLIFRGYIKKALIADTLGDLR